MSGIRSALYYKGDKKTYITSVIKKDGVYLKGQPHRPVDLIIRHRRSIEKLFTVLVLLSLLCFPMVGVNYDLTKYLPDSTPSAQALDIMQQEFTYPGMGRVMLQDVTLYEAKNIKDRIAEVDTDYNDRPIVPQVMKKVTAETFGVVYPEPEKK